MLLDMVNKDQMVQSTGYEIVCFFVLRAKTSKYVIELCQGFIIVIRMSLPTFGGGAKNCENMCDQWFPEDN